MSRIRLYQLIHAAALGIFYLILIPSIFLSSIDGWHWLNVVTIPLLTGIELWNSLILRSLLIEEGALVFQERPQYGHLFYLIPFLTLGWFIWSYFPENLDFLIGPGVLLFDLLLKIVMPKVLFCFQGANFFLFDYKQSKVPVKEIEEWQTESYLFRFRYHKEDFSFSLRKKDRDIFQKKVTRRMPDDLL